MRQRFPGARMTSWLFSLTITVVLATAAPAAENATSRGVAPDYPVTHGQIKAWKDWVQKSIQDLNRRESRLETEAKTHPLGKGAPPDQTVDLTAPPTTGTETTKSKGPWFQTYFDLNLVNQPGTYDALAFDNYHSLMFVDLFPSPDLTFSFNLLGPTTFPIFYELDWQATPRVTLRAGKIWIPFDDLSALSPHNIFGGRVGLQQLMPTTSGNLGQLFLPSLWTELGVGAKLLVVDSPEVLAELLLTITNGFTNNGSDPLTGGEGPSFSAYTPAPNQQGAGSSGSHRNKAYDMRAHVQLVNRLGLGLSYYTSQWNPDEDPVTGNGKLFLNMIGVDGQLKLPGGVDFRAGIATMKVQYPESTATRGGLYGELGVPFLGKWKALARAGSLQLDSRIVQPTDITVVGGTLIYYAGPVQLSIEHSRNLNTPAVPLGFNQFTDFRIVALF